MASSLAGGGLEWRMAFEILRRSGEIVAFFPGGGTPGRDA
jgi:hypothetical protein